MRKHPVEDAIARMSPRDQQIADGLAEAGYSDEDLYAALPNPGADRLLRSGRVPCPACGKNVKAIGLADHQRDAHGVALPREGQPE